MSCLCCTEESQKKKSVEYPTPVGFASPETGKKTALDLEGNSPEQIEIEEDTGRLSHIKLFNRADFTWKGVLGEGAFAKVFHVQRNKDEFEMACKKIDTSCFTDEQLEQQVVEIETMKRLSGQHKTTLNFYEVSRIGEEIFILFELCNGGTLQEGLKHHNVTSENAVKEIAKQVFEGLDFLHKNNIAHMDLKLDNIGFKHSSAESLEIRLLDFGVTTHRESGSKAQGAARGTPHYMAPEILMDRGFTEQADQWSMGVILFHLITGKLPFKFGRKIPNEEEAVRRILDRSKLRFPEITSKKARDIILALLHFDAPKRPTPSDILKYPWFLSNEDVKLTEKVVERFELFSKRGILQKALIPLMLEHVKDVDGHLIEYARELHANTDKDANGEFDFEEFKLCMSQVDSTKWSEEELRNIFDSIDSDGSGEVSLKEFMTWFSYDYVYTQDERIWEFIHQRLSISDEFVTLDGIRAALTTRDGDYLKYMFAFEQVLEPEKKYDIEYIAKLLINDDENYIGGSEVSVQFVEKEIEFRERCSSYSDSCSESSVASDVSKNHSSWSDLSESFAI